jgi:hypothetical protein
MHKYLQKASKIHKNLQSSFEYRANLRLKDESNHIHLKKQSQCRPSTGNPKRMEGYAIQTQFN